MNTIKLNTIGEAPIKKGGGGGNFKYFSLSEYNDNYDVKEWVAYYGQYIKYQWHQKSDDETSDDSWIESDVAGKVSIATATIVYDRNWSQIDFIAVAIDMDARIYNEWENEWLDPRPLLENWSGVKFSDLKEISKEEFYSITLSKDNLKFTLQGYNGASFDQPPMELEYEEGMTWGQWVDSEYNTIGLSVREPSQIVHNSPIVGEGLLSHTSQGWAMSEQLIDGSYQLFYMG